MPFRSTPLRLIALFEALKGVLLLGVSAGLLQLLHGNARGVAEALVAHAHLDPDHGPAHVFLALAADATDARLWLLALVAIFDAAIRLAMGWGLWHARTWAYWLGATAGLVYVPIELVGIAEHLTIPRVMVLAINVAIVVYLIRGIRTGASLR